MNFNICLIIFTCFHVLQSYLGDFHKNLRDLLTKIIIENMDTWKVQSANNLGNSYNPSSYVIVVIQPLVEIMVFRPRKFDIPMARDNLFFSVGQANIFCQTTMIFCPSDSIYLTANRSLSHRPHSNPKSAIVIVLAGMTCMMFTMYTGPRRGQSPSKRGDAWWCIRRHTFIKMWKVVGKLDVTQGNLIWPC